jgi:hypothetical protein
MSTPTLATAQEALNRLEQERAAMLDPLDIPGSWTRRELYAYEDRRSRLTSLVARARAAVLTLAKVEPQWGTLTNWRDHLVDWRARLSDELLADEPRNTDPKAQVRINGLKLSIIRIDRGLDLVHDMLPANLRLDDLMREAGYIPHDAVARAHGEAWHGSLPDVQARLKELERRRADAWAVLSAAVGAEAPPVAAHG